MRYAAPGARRQYVEALRTADDCAHGTQGGDIIRPWTGTPSCALCRRRHWVHWVPATPREQLPNNVVPINERKLW